MVAATDTVRLGGGRRGAWMMRVLVVDGVDAALAGASALIGAIGDDAERDSDDGEDGEENEDDHQVLPGPDPCSDVRGEASSAQPRKPLLFIRCRLAACSRLKA